MDALLGIDVDMTSTPDPFLKCHDVQEYFVKETGACMLCSKHCNGCFGPTASECFRCHTMKFFGTCIDQCPLGFEPEEGNSGDCVMSQSIAALFCILTLSLFWFTIVVCCKWKRYKRHVKQQNLPPSNVSVSDSDPPYRPSSSKPGSPTLSLQSLPISSTSLIRSSSNRINQTSRVGSSPNLQGKQEKRTLYGMDSNASTSRGPITQATSR